MNNPTRGLLLAAYYKGKDGDGYSNYELDQAETALNAYILGEVMELVGYDTQTMHDDNGISDFANMDIDIAITDLINWVNNGGKIDIHEKNRLKNRIIERVHGSRQEHGANQLRQELRNKANKKFGGK